MSSPDGIAAVATTGAVLDANPDAPATPARPWTPAPPDRNLALIRGGIDQVKQIAHAHHATVNDVLLAVTADGLRGLLRSRGEPVEDLIVRIDVPVTLRPAQLRDQARGNLIGQFVVPLPIGVPDPGRRLAQIATDTATRKAESQPSVGTVLRS
jgi:diacylglycerol O-acyltransferase / wax synthase